MLRINRSNRNWNRSQRRRYQENEFDIQFDWNRPLNQCCYLILNYISSNDAVSNKNQLLAYLNLFIKYCLYRYRNLEPLEQQGGQHDHFDTFTDAEIFCCLRISLFNEAAEIRAASLRAIRYFIRTKSTLLVLLELNLHHLIARSLDIVLENRLERIQAMRLVRHIMAIEPNLFPLTLGRCICAISHDNLLEKDILLRVCWATIAELTTVNATISAKSGCINVLIRCALNSITGLNLSSEFDDPFKNRNTAMNLVSSGTMNNFTIPYSNIAISEAILSSFLNLYNFPETRKLLQPNGMDLFYFISPFTDLYSFYHDSKAAKERQEKFDLPDVHPKDDYKMNVDQKENKPRPMMNKNNQQLFLSFEQRTLRYLACKNAIISILHSWPGLFFMCRTINCTKQNKRFSFNNSDIKKFDSITNNIEQMLSDNCQFNYGLQSLNPLKSLVRILHLPYAEVHRHLIELFYELFGLRPPVWSDNFDETLKCIYFNYQLTKSKNTCNNQTGKNYFPSEWELYDGFVAKEAEDIMPSQSSTRLNFITNYHALLLQCLVEFGLLEALISVILNSSDNAAVNLATILAGELLYLSGKYLPPSPYAHRCQSLPTLVDASISGSRERRNKALMAITNFNRIHNIKKLGPQPASLFLEQQIYFCKKIDDKIKLHSTFISKYDDNVITSIKNSGVLGKHSYRDWNWSIIMELLKQPYEMMRKLEEKDVRTFTSRLVDFYCPSKRQFSIISKNVGLNTSDSTNTSNSTGRYEISYVDNPRLIVSVAIHFFDFLLQTDETRSSEFIEKFIYDLDHCLKNIASKSPSPEEILLPSRLLSTLSHYYFLLLGRLTHFKLGRSLLKKTNIYQHLIDLINVSSNEVYIKLIVSSLDYGNLEFSRSYLSKVLTSSLESARLYATKFIRVLLRCGLADFSKWAIDLLVTQLNDQSNVVCTETLDILDEACAENVGYLEEVLKHRPSLLNLGDKGIVFFTRFASYPVGLQMLMETNLLENEIKRWKTHYCLRYVRLVEDSLNECFSCHQKGVMGKYGRRSDKRTFLNIKNSNMSVHVVPHLYGQLVQTYAGLQMIIKHSILEDLLQTIGGQLNLYLFEDANKFVDNGLTEVDILRMKSALWSIGHIASSESGIDYIINYEPSLIHVITLLIERSLVLSIRATCFHVICLIASTYKGANTLSHYGWTAIQHSHLDSFPIDQQEFEYFHQTIMPRNVELDKCFVKTNKSVASLPSGYFFHSSDENTIRPCQLSISSSSSSSSSYLSILPSKHNASNSLISTINENQNQSSKEAANENVNSSSTISLYSNTSSIGSLVNNIHNTMATMVTPNNRIRSSSDCLATGILNSDSNNSTKCKNCKDSGILDQFNDKFGQANRNRKISAPCFPMSSIVNNKKRSDSYESAQTNTESRSTSFTEYSTTSSHGSNVEKCRGNVGFVENKSLSPSTSKERKHILVDRPVVVIPDDPYPSQADAYGYAQLRVIQKHRVQTLSGNAYSFNIPMNNVSMPSNFEPPRKILSPIQTENNHSNVNQLTFEQTKQRSVSGSSQFSNQSEISFENESLSNSNVIEDKSNFMCLCLPQSLSYIFYLDESKEKPIFKKRVKFPNDFKTRKLSETNTVHPPAKCLLCCYNKNFIIDNLDDQKQNSSETINFSVETNLDPNHKSSNALENNNPHQEVLNLVSNLSAALPNHTKQAEQGLLSLKQKFPALFENICLYSDVCFQMENNNYKASARRFLHELFLDINLEQFFNIAKSILKKYETIYG